MKINVELQVDEIIYTDVGLFYEIHNSNLTLDKDLKPTEINPWNNDLHRLDGPANIEYYHNGLINTEYYYINNEYHRLDGPARVVYNKGGTIIDEEYWLYDIEYNKEDYYAHPEVQEFLKSKEFDKTMVEILQEA